MTKTSPTGNWHKHRLPTKKIKMVLDLCNISRTEHAMRYLFCRKFILIFKSFMYIMMASYFN